MIGAAQKTIPMPAGSPGLALEGDVLRVLGVDAATAQAYLDQVRAAWLDIVRTDALDRLTRAGTAVLRAIREELSDAQEAEALGVPPPGGRSAAELQTLMDQGRAAFRAVYDAVQGAQSVAEINAALAGARDQGLNWLVGSEWEPYPETCPWVVGA